MTTILAAEQIVRQTNTTNVTLQLHPLVHAPPLNILCDSCLCRQRKLSSCICRTGNRIAAEEQLEFQFLAGIAAEQIVQQTNATNVTLHPLVQAP